MARKKIVWTEKQFRQFETLCSRMCTEEEICSVLDVTDKTLNRLLKEHYGMGYTEAYRKFSSVGKISLRHAQFKAAERGNPQMLIWLGKQYLGQKEPEREKETAPTEIEDMSAIRRAVFVDGGDSSKNT